MFGIGNAFVLRVAIELASFTDTERMMLAAGCKLNRPLAAAIDRNTEFPKERSLLVAIARFESGCRESAVGDHGVSLGAFQWYDAPASALFDINWQARQAVKMVRESWTLCGRSADEYRLGVYVRGVCDSPRARELSSHRVALAKKIGGWK